MEERHRVHGTRQIPAALGFGGRPVSRREVLRLGLGAGATLLAGGTLATLAGCSSGGSAVAATTTTSSAAYTLITAGTLTVTSDLSTPPFESVDTSSNQAVGFDVDMTKALADRMGLGCTWLATRKFDTLIPTIKAGGVADVSCASMTITDARREEVDFTDPYINSNQSLVMRSSSTVTSPDAINDASVKLAVESGTTGESWAQENIPKATIVELDDVIQVLTGISTGLYDATIFDLPIMEYMCKTSYTDLKVCAQIPTGEQYGMAVSKDDPGLTSALNDALGQITDDGTLAGLMTQWFGSSDMMVG